MKASTLGCPAVDPPSTPERIASGHSDDPFEHTQIQTHKNTRTHKFKHTKTHAHTNSNTDNIYKCKLTNIQKGLTQVNTSSRWIILSVFESMLTNSGRGGVKICCQL